MLSAIKTIAAVYAAGACICLPCVLFGVHGVAREHQRSVVWEFCWIIVALTLWPQFAFFLWRECRRAMLPRPPRNGRPPR